MQKKQPSAPQDSKRQPREETHLEGLASIASMLIIWSFVMGFVLQNFVIPSSSMASTLLVGDHVIVERATLAPASTWTNLIPYRELRRDEPVVFFRPAPNPEGQHDILVKRVIGIPGDRIHLPRDLLPRRWIGYHRIDQPVEGRPSVGVLQTGAGMEVDRLEHRGQNIQGFGVAAEAAVPEDGHRSLPCATQTLRANALP